MAGHNGELEVRVPMIGVRLAGRDLLLAAALIALGAGAIAAQYVSLMAFQTSLHRDLVRVFVQAERAEAERQTILAVLRARSCGEALAAPAPKETPR